MVGRVSIPAQTMSSRVPSTPTKTRSLKVIYSLLPREKGKKKFKKKNEISFSPTSCSSGRWLSFARSSPRDYSSGSKKYRKAWKKTQVAYPHTPQGGGGGGVFFVFLTCRGNTKTKNQLEEKKKQTNKLRFFTHGTQKKHKQTTT